MTNQQAQERRFRAACRAEAARLAKMAKTVVKDKPVCNLSNHVVPSREEEQ